MFTFPDTSAPEKILYELFFRSMVPHLVNRCHGNCGDKLFPAGKEDYLVVKSRGRISFMNNQDEMDSKYCPLYIHFKAECLKEYTRRIHDVHYEACPFSENTFGKDTFARLPEKEKVFLEETGVDVSNNQEQSFLHNFFKMFTVYTFNLYLIIGFFPFYFHLINYITTFSCLR